MLETDEDFSALSSFPPPSCPLLTASYDHKAPWSPAPVSMIQDDLDPSLLHVLTTAGLWTLSCDVPSLCASKLKLPALTSAGSSPADVKAWPSLTLTAPSPSPTNLTVSPLMNGHVLTLTFSDGTRTQLNLTAIRTLHAAEGLLPEPSTSVKGSTR